MILFLVIVFLDQNSAPVPIKIILGKPFQVELSIIVIVSMLIGTFLTIGGGVLFKKIRTKKKNKETA